MKICQDMMTKNPECCLASETVYQVAQRMQSFNIGVLPVVADHETQKLIGMITDRDLVIRVISTGRDVMTTLIGDVMTSEPAVCRPSDYLTTILETMSKRQIRRLPVVNDQGRILGIIAQADLALHLENHHKVGQMVYQISKPQVAPAAKPTPTPVPN
jgi:CBS domain-containing protein